MGCAGEGTGLGLMGLEVGFRGLRFRAVSCMQHCTWCWVLNDAVSADANEGSYSQGAQCAPREGWECS